MVPSELFESRDQCPAPRRYRGHSGSPNGHHPTGLCAIVLYGPYGSSYGHEALTAQVPSSLRLSTDKRPVLMMRLDRRTLLCGMALPLARNERRAHAIEDAWIRCAPAPVARSEVPAAVLDGLIYVVVADLVGQIVRTDTTLWTTPGWSWHVCPWKPITAERWRLLTRSIVAGGYTADGSAAHDAIWALDPTSDSWVQIGTLPAAMGAFGFVAVGDELFLAGGALEMLGGEPSGETWSWDPLTDVWTARAPIPRVREHLAMVSGTVCSMPLVDEFMARQARNLVKRWMCTIQ